MGEGWALWVFFFGLFFWGVGGDQISDTTQINGDDSDDGGGENYKYNSKNVIYIIFQENSQSNTQSSLLQSPQSLAFVGEDYNPKSDFMGVK